MAHLYGYCCVIQSTMKNNLPTADYYLTRQFDLYKLDGYLVKSQEQDYQS